MPSLVSNTDAQHPTLRQRFTEGGVLPNVTKVFLVSTCMQLGILAVFIKVHLSAQFPETAHVRKTASCRCGCRFLTMHTI